MKLSKNITYKVCPQNAYASFFNALCEDGVKPLVQTAAELYECPVLLTDEHYRLICEYPEHRLGQNIWDSLHDTGVLPIDTIWEYQQAFLKDSSSIYEPFYADWGLAKEAPRIFGEVYTSSKRILGHFAIFKQDKPLDPYDLEVARIFAQALEIRLSQKKSKETSNAEYLLDLLTDNSCAQSRYFAASILGRRLKSRFCVMVTPIGTGAAQQAFAVSAADRLSLSFRNTVSAIYQNCIVTLFGEMSLQNQTSSERVFLTRAADTLKKSFPCCGVSSCFNELIDTGKYYYQAYCTAMLEKPGVSFYTDKAPEPLFALLASEERAAAFIHPVLYEIYKYDEEHHTQYFQTLEAYSLSMHNKDAAADRLCVHRNTLIYRLNRIGEIFHLPYEEERTALYLLNSFQLWMIKKSLPESD